MRLVPHVLYSLTGRSNQRFVDQLVAQLDAGIAGAVLTRRTVAGEVGRATAYEEMRTIEHAGDAARGTLVVELETALVTPIDREDLFRLSRALDDILDNLRDFLRLWDLFEMDRDIVIEPVLDAICDALVELRAAVASMMESPELITRRALAAKKSGNAVRRAHDMQLAVLYRAPLSVDTLMVRDLLRRLDVVGLRFATAANTLSDAAIKRAES